MAAKKSEHIEVVEFNTGKAEFYLLGRTPIILNRMTEKVKHILLMPTGKKTAAEKAVNVKHNPLEEFRNSPYLNTNPKAETFIEHLSTSFKAAIRSAGVDVPGATKAQLGRLMWVEGEKVPIWGTPRIIMSVVRCADMGRTPDVRTRAIIPEWAARLTISFVQPKLNIKTISRLLAAAGLIQGVGDWRPEKGSGTYGQFEVVAKDDPRLLSVMKNGRKKQELAMANPVPYDRESEELITWFNTEAEHRGLKVVGGK